MNIIAKYAYEIRNSLNKPGDYNFVKTIEMGESIPKIIHQIYHTKDLPEVFTENIAKIKAENPDWEYRIYDENDIDTYISLHHPNLFGIYKKINPNYIAARADFFRYLVVYSEGGVYLDIKSSLSAPLNQIIQKDDKYLLSHWAPRQLGMYKGITNPNGELQQWHVIATKGHPFLKRVIDNVCNNILHYNPLIHDFGFWAVLNTTGPVAYTETIYPLLDKHPHRLAQSQADHNLIYSIFREGGMKVDHSKTYTRKHYSKLEEPLIKQNILINSLFYATKPVIKFLKSKLKKMS
jgi:inositol phosphorylceramide mannosyltransferase catalytic subunit